METKEKENLKDKENILDNEKKDTLDVKNEYLKDNNTLLLSEKEQKAFLPYKIDDVKEYLKNSNTYKTEQEVIEGLYVVPFDVYKHPSISRFKEAFSLAKMENYSFKKSLDLGLEVMFKYNLNPAIITACKNMDEFDMYLAALDENKLQDFKCFDIVYSFAPTIVKK